IHRRRSVARVGELFLRVGRSREVQTGGTMRNSLFFPARWAAMIALAASSTAHAHHKYALHDRCNSGSLEGESASIEWTTPHVLIDLRTGDTAYRIESAALPQLAQA